MYIYLSFFIVTVPLYKKIVDEGKHFYENIPTKKWSQSDGIKMSVSNPQWINGPSHQIPMVTNIPKER